MTEALKQSFGFNSVKYFFKHLLSTASINPGHTQCLIPNKTLAEIKKFPSGPNHEYMSDLF